MRINMQHHTLIDVPCRAPLIIRGQRAKGTYVNLQNKNKSKEEN